MIPRYVIRKCRIKSGGLKDSLWLPPSPEYRWKRKAMEVALRLQREEPDYLIKFYVWDTMMQREVF